MFFLLKALIRKMLRMFHFFLHIIRTVYILFLFSLWRLWHLISHTLSMARNVSVEIVLITGAGHGLGREMALRFARLGAIVVCVDINANENNETLLMIKEKNGKAFKYECDVTNRTAVFELSEKVKVEVGDVTILVNNTGIMPRKSFLKQTETDIKKMIDVNMFGYLWMMQAFLPTMIAKNQGHVVAISPMSDLMGLRHLVPKSASKYAVNGIMDLVMELEGGIQSTTVYPHIVDTDAVQKPHNNFPILEVVKPGDAADLIVDAVRRNYMVITLPPILNE